MIHLNKLTIKTRMILAFILLASMTVILGVAAVVEVQHVGRFASQLYEHPLQVSNASLAANWHSTRIHRSMKDVVLSGSEAEFPSLGLWRSAWETSRPCASCSNRFLSFVET